MQCYEGTRTRERATMRLESGSLMLVAIYFPVTDYAEFPGSVPDRVILRKSHILSAAGPRTCVT